MIYIKLAVIVLSSIWMLKLAYAGETDAVYSNTTNNFLAGLLTNQIIGNSGSTTVAVGASSGTGATVSVSGNNLAGQVTLNTGTSTTASGTLFTLTWAGAPLAAAPKACPFTMIGTNSLGQVGMIDIAGFPTTSGFTVQAGGTAIPASTTFLFTYGVCGG